MKALKVILIIVGVLFMISILTLIICLFVLIWNFDNPELMILPTKIVLTCGLSCMILYFIGSEIDDEIEEQELNKLTDESLKDETIDD